MKITSDSEKVTVWGTMSVNEVTGPYYVDNAIVNAESYINSLKNFFHLMLPNFTLTLVSREMVPRLPTVLQYDSYWMKHYQIREFGTRSYTMTSLITRFNFN